MGDGCRMLTPAEAGGIVPALKAGALDAALHSGHEIRVESREAVPKLARWLEAEMGVAFRRSTVVRAVAPPVIETSSGAIRAARAAGARMCLPTAAVAGSVRELLGM